MINQLVDHSQTWLHIYCVIISYIYVLFVMDSRLKNLRKKINTHDYILHVRLHLNIFTVYEMYMNDFVTS
jgi:hypothetical protein